MPRQLRWLAPALAITLWLAAHTASAATITIVPMDGPAEGFNDPTPASPVGGNLGATLGALRLNAFTHAAGIWAAALASSVEIRVEATMDPLSCGLLGFAGPINAAANFAGAPAANTLYPIALANKLAGIDLDPANNDIDTTFTSSTGCSFGLYYGLDGNPDPGDVDLVSVVIHELAHGLGSLTFVNLTSGAKASGFDDPYMANLRNESTGLNYPAMTDAQRVAASKNTGNLTWSGAGVVAAAGTLTAGRHASGRPRIYAPNPVQGGSSVSHWDTVLSPDQIMEPSYTGPNHSIGLSEQLFEDLGWGAVGATCGDGVMEGGEECDLGDLIDGDGCDSNCTITGCGNGLATSGEECDDGNASSSDACKNDCTNNVCGDTVVRTGVEQCDDGDLTDGDGCDANCTPTACGNGITTVGEECDDGNSDGADGCTNACTICGNGAMTAPEQCDDGNLINGDGCQATCSNTGQLPELDFGPLGTTKDYRSVSCQRIVGFRITTYQNTKMSLLRGCLNKIQEHTARVTAALPAGDIQAAVTAAAKACVEGAAADPDSKTMLGKLATARVAAISAIEKSCGPAGGTALDGKTIGNFTSGDFVQADVVAHVDRVGCAVEELVAGAYANAGTDLASFTARASQGGNPLNTYFPCFDQADVPAADYSPVAGRKDIRSVICQTTLAAQAQSYRNTKLGKLRGCLDAAQEHKARVEAGLTPATIQAGWEAAVKRCLEFKAADPDEKTMLGMLAGYRTKAISAVERQCGPPAGIALDGRAIPASASNDFTLLEITAHLDHVECSVDAIIAAAYPDTQGDLAQFTVRPSQGGDTLDLHFPCLDQ